MIEKLIGFFKQGNLSSFVSHLVLVCNEDTSTTAFSMQRLNRNHVFIPELLHCKYHNKNILVANEDEIRE